MSDKLLIWRGDHPEFKHEAVPIGTAGTVLGTTDGETVEFIAQTGEGGTPQTLSIDGSQLSISGGNTVTLPSSVIGEAINIDEVEVLANQWTDLSLTLNPQ
jgi:hypothetical protein